jgi:hypothetical protein
VRRFISFIPLLFLAIAPLRAAESQLQITTGEGARALGNIATGETVYQRGPDAPVRATDGDVLLLADEIGYTPATKVAVARGHVVLTRGALRLLAEQLTYNAATHAY